MSETHRDIKTIDTEINTRELTISMGPQHPSAHGVLRLICSMQGERITKAMPEVGYLHRGTEKIAENLYYPQFVPYTDRLDYMAGMSNNLGYVSAVEKLMDLEVPERAQYIRVMMAELSRMSGHLICIGAWAVDLGALTPFLYAVREREMILDLFEMICGARMTYSYLCMGGVRWDATPEFMEKCAEYVDVIEERLGEYDVLLTGNRIWYDRNKDVGIISAEDAINIGLGGPSLRASGVKWDIRKDAPYLIYDKLDFDVPVGEVGDCLDRYQVRMEEMRQSLRIIRQCLEKMPEGPFKRDDLPEINPPAKPDIYNTMESLIHHFKYVTHGFNVPEGEVYSAVEAPKGELGFYIISDGSNTPFRLKIRAPSFVNVHALDYMCKGEYFADVIAIVSSLDPVFGECDK